MGYILRKKTEQCRRLIDRQTHLSIECNEEGILTTAKSNQLPMRNVSVILFILMKGARIKTALVLKDE